MSRRSLLGMAPAVAVGTAATIANVAPAQAADAEVAPDGWRESEHVRLYYRCARF